MFKYLPTKYQNRDLKDCFLYLLRKKLKVQLFDNQDIFFTCEPNSIHFVECDGFNPKLFTIKHHSCMKKIFKILSLLLGVLVLVVAGALTYVKTALPNVGDAPDLKVDVTPERVKHGEYLANHVLVCMDCHSTRDWSKFAGPPTPGAEGKGGEIFDEKVGFPGRFYSRNITPAGLKDWTDGEIFRAITCGVSRDGSPLFPVMPYAYYRNMDEEDVKDVIAYLRSIPAVESENKPSEANFPMNFIMHTIPQAADLQKRPDPANTVAYGKYLVMTAGCFECHTKPDDKGQKLPGMDFAGGWEFNMSTDKFTYGFVTAANISPDPETGIGNWTKEAFVARFKAYADSSYKPPTLQKGEFQSVMPWMMYAGMTTSDIGAIYDYLRTVKPVKNKVEKFRSTLAMK